MRCVLCDYCDTAGSLSRVSERRPSKLIWDDIVGGYVCGDGCGVFIDDPEDAFIVEDEDEI